MNKSKINAILKDVSSSVKDSFKKFYKLYNGCDDKEREYIYNRVDNYGIRLFYYSAILVDEYGFKVSQAGKCLSCSNSIIEMKNKDIPIVLRNEIQCPKNYVKMIDLIKDSIPLPTRKKELLPFVNMDCNEQFDFIRSYTCLSYYGKSEMKEYGGFEIQVVDVKRTNNGTILCIQYGPNSKKWMKEKRVEQMSNSCVTGKVVKI